jgi:methyl coenzyme M reductase beta subunit
VGGTGLASKLNADLPLLNLLSAQLRNGTVGVLLSSKVDEGISDGTASAGISGDRGRLTKLG